MLRTWCLTLFSKKVTSLGVKEELVLWPQAECLASDSQLQHVHLSSWSSHTFSSMITTVISERIWSLRLVGFPHLLAKLFLCYVRGKSLINGSHSEVSSLWHYKCHIIPMLDLGNYIGHRLTEINSAVMLSCYYFHHLPLL